YRVGRQADALTVYRQGRDVLAEELGLEPGPELQGLQQRILSRDDTLFVRRRESPAAESAAGSADSPAVAAIPPRHLLPRDIVDCTGREATVARLLSLVPEDPTSSRAAPTIEVIDGMAGAGKTSLAVHVAHLAAPGYPDAQLFIDLHGHSDRAPVEPATALDALLRQLGVPADRIPERLDERVAAWRAELGARRAVVVLDNAADPAPG